MVAIIHKWSVISCMCLLTMLNQRVNNEENQLSNTSWHPLHVSVTEINHNATEKTLEVSVKLFTDDFEKALTQNYNKKVDLINPTDRPAMEKLVSDYIHRHLIIRADGKASAFNMLGFEKDNDAVYAYFQIDNIVSVKTIAATNTLMHDMFTDQINLMHVTVGGKRQSTKMVYPEKEASIGF